MAGQQQQQYRNTPLTQPDITAAPSVATTPQQFTVSHVDASGQVSALQSLSNSFGGFFQNLNSTAARVNQTVEQGRLANIQRENEALEKQGIADYTAGKAPDAAADGREAYHAAYQHAFAQNHASEMAQELAARLRSMPQDGSVDPAAVAKQVSKDFFGAGTGDLDFDAALAGRYAPAAQSMIAQAKEHIAQTQEQNQTVEIQNAAANQINSPLGMTEAGFATLTQQVDAVTHGNRALSDKMIGSFMGSVRNKTQALNYLNVLATSGWADRNPVAYEKMSQDAVRQIQTVKSVQAAQEVDGIRLAASALKMNPNATPQDWAGLLYQAQRVDANHGVGIDKFGYVMEGLQAASKQQAVINAFSLAEQGHHGTHNINTIATLLGADPDELRKTGYEPYLVRKIGQDGGQRFPGLYASMQSNAGLPDPLASDQAGAEFVGWVTAPGIRDISGGTMPVRIQRDLSSAIKSGSPDRAARAWRIMDRIHDQVGDHAFGQYLGKDDEASAMYWGVKALAPTNGDVSQVYKAIRDGGMDAKLLEKVGSGGSVNWQPLLPGKKQADIDVAVDKAMGKAMLADVGRTGLIWNPSTSMSSDMRHQFQGIVLQQLMAQRTNGQVDFDVAVENAATVFKGTRMATVGMNGTVKIIDDPFGGRGRAVGVPINTSPDHPYSTAKGYAPIYSSFPMANAAGQYEDPFKTAQGDLRDLSEALPGIVTDSAGLSLKRPDGTGLSQIHDSLDNPIIVHGGQKIAIRRAADEGVTEQTANNFDDPDFYLKPGKRRGELIQGEVPKDPKAAAAFFKDNLPPGVYAVYDQQHNQYTLNYGYRLKVTEADAAKMRAQRAADYERARPFRDAQRSINAEFPALYSGTMQ